MSNKKQLMLNERLVGSVRAGDLLAVARHIKDGASVNRCTEDRQYKDDPTRPPLSVAAEEGRDDIIRLLIKSGANIEGLDEYEVTPLLEAAFHGRSSSVKILLDHGADFKWKSKAGNTALMLAASSNHINEVLTFLDLGVSLSDVTDLGHNALMQSAIYGAIEVVDKLIEIGINLDLQDDEGLTALMHAAKYGYKSMAMLLINAGAAGSIENNSGLNAININKEMSNFMIAHLENKQVLDAVEKSECLASNEPVAINKLDTALIRAIRDNDIPLLESLFKQGAQIKSSTFREATESVMCLAAEFCSTDALAKVLLAHGANVNQSSSDLENETYWTPISWAIAKNNLPVIQLLVENGVDVNAICDVWNSGDPHNTPLSEAAEINNAPVVRLLVSLGADLELEDGTGRTPASKAILSKSNRALEALLELGADYTAIYSNGDTLLDIAITAENPEAISMIENKQIIDAVNNHSPKPIGMKF